MFIIQTKKNFMLIIQKYDNYGENTILTSQNKGGDKRFRITVNTYDSDSDEFISICVIGDNKA